MHEKEVLRARYDAEGDIGVAPAVSAIVPTYQRRELVKRAVASVFSQTYRDFELIVVDDGSTDGTAEALAAVGDDRLVYHWQSNRGVSAARNTGIRLARGAILAFLDCDNRWLPDHWAVVTKALGAYPTHYRQGVTNGCLHTASAPAPLLVSRRP
jgi:glycosyltransferase involved in cell wall biosynthesis